jgi:2-phosphosulfolactate phosphatase
MSSCIRAITGRGGSQLVREVTRELVRTHLRTAPAAQKFFDPAASWAPQRDFDICTAVDEYDFALAWQRASDGLGVLQRSGPG